MLKCKPTVPPVTGWLEIELDKNIIDYLNTRIDAAIVEDDSVKDQLAGHISSSLNLIDKDDFFTNNVLLRCAEQYYQAFPTYPSRNINHTSTTNNLVLNDWWVNFQKKHEYNPTHGHGGLYSFVVWMKIPTDSKEQSKLDFLKGLAKSNVSNFEMTYMDTLGDVCHYTYDMSPLSEGRMLFFPAKMKHCVYPFYECDEDRITISGNLYFK